MGNSLAIFLHASRYDRIYQALNMEATAVSMEWRCYLFLFFDALASFMEGSWDEVNITGGNSLASEPRPEIKTPMDDGEKLQKAFELANFPSLYEILAQTRQSGRLTLCACSASVKLLGLDPKTVKNKVDEIIGLPTMLQITAGVSHSLYI